MNRTFNIIALCSSLMLGFAFIAMLPPWEGMDEYAHYSAVQEVAHTGRWPRMGQSHISSYVERTRTSLPAAYASAPPHDAVFPFTYREFAASAPAAKAVADRMTHLPPGEARRFEHGPRLNWQAQHPPLYYLVLAPVYRLTIDWSLGHQLLSLRLVSYLMAWSALVLVVRALWSLPEKTLSPRTVNVAVAAIVLWPLMIPSWYGDMARLTNDTLCAFLLACVFAILVKPRSLRRPVNELILGTLLGLGCLTKAFFLPVGAGVIAWLIWTDHLAARPVNRRRLLRSLACVVLPLIVIAGWWYLGNIVEGRPLTGSEEFGRLDQGGGLRSSLEGQFSILQWLRGHAAFFATFAWTVSWSFGRPHLIFVVVPLAIIVGAIVGMMMARRDRHGDITLLPAFVLLPVFLGFSYHVLTQLALHGRGAGTGGYYLNFAAPLFGLGLGVLLSAAWPRKWSRRPLIGGLLAAHLLVIFGWYAQFRMLGGTAWQTAESHVYRFGGDLLSIAGLQSAAHNLQYLAYPALSVMALCVHLLLVAGAAVGFMRNR